ncbi:hypothetical protein ACQ4PT_033421 [Festuca glaucescens]
MAESTGGKPRLPEDLVLQEILTRLPSKPLLRCRAVCRSWRRRLTSDAAFLLAHHRRQPALQLVTTGNAREGRIDALDHRAGERRPVVRTDRAAAPEDLELLASCDGLLIVSAYRALHICNPATRQRAPLPQIHGACISGLYPHRPPGSYRVLCWTKVPADAEDGRTVYYVYTVGSGELRCVGEPPEQWATGDVATVMPMSEFFHPHVLVHGRFHWRPVELPGRKHNNMLVFDTVAESFRHVRTPVEGPWADPFELKGELALYNYNGFETADLWVLEDYEDNFWTVKFRIQLQRPMIFLVPDAQGDVFVTSVKKGSVGIVSQCLKHMSGADGSVLSRHQWNVRLNLKRHRFKESLVRHDFFLAEGNGAVDETPLFNGLSSVAVLPDDDS